MPDSDPSEPTKAYYVEYTVREMATALVYADSAKEAVEKWRRGEDEWSTASGQAEIGGMRNVRRYPNEDRDA